jgi:hypothetical protein
MGWTLATARAQPYEDILLLAADFLLEAEGASPPPEGPRGAPPPAPGRTRQTHTTTYTAA